MKTVRRRLVAASLGGAFYWGGGVAPAFAQGEVLFQPEQKDVARAWLDLLFRGAKLPDSIAYDAPNLGSVADGLHRALSVYSYSILILATFLLIYNLAVMVVETAHHGVPFGRRSTQIWAPIRLVLAIGFLVPVSSGLNAGQYLVAWMTEQGSGLASHLWQLASDSMRDTFSGIALPQGPNVTGFVTTGLEMEFCRSLYRRAFDALQDDPVVPLAGTIGDIFKQSRSRFAEETWLYTNHLQASVPLCGAYRFASAHNSGQSVTANRSFDRLTGELADFSRSETEKLISELQPVADTAMPVFLGDAAGTGVHDSVAHLIGSHQAAVDDRLRRMVGDNAGLMQQTMTSSADSGWITAGGFMLQLSRLQDMYGTLAAHALPAAQPPLLESSNFQRASVTEAIAADPKLWNYTPDQTASLMRFYAQVERTQRLMHVWVYDHELADVSVILANPFDLRDQMVNGNDPEAISSLFAHIVNDGAVTYGIWNSSAGSSSALDKSDQPLLALPSAVRNAITVLAEFGRRQTGLGNYLIGIASPDVAPAGTLIYSILLTAVGFLFLVSGFALSFLVPLLPFIRFFVGVLTWLLSVFEAIIAVPLVALAHLNLNGEGLSGGAARQAYLLWLNIIIRPALILFGLITGLLLFTLAIIFLGMVFYQLARLAPPSSADMFVTVNVALTFLYTILVCAAANVSFKGITFLPELATKWLGSFVTMDRPDAPVLANPNTPGLQNLPNISSVTASFLARHRVPGNQSGNMPERGMSGGELKSPHGQKLALFPTVRDGGSEKPADSTKTISTEIKQDSGSTGKGNDSFRDTTSRLIQGYNPFNPRPDKKPRDNSSNLGKNLDLNREGKSGAPKKTDQQDEPPPADKGAPKEPDNS